MNSNLSNQLKKDWATLTRNPKGAAFALIPDPHDPVLILARKAAEVSPVKVLSRLRVENLSVQSNLIYVGQTTLTDGQVRLVIDPEASRGAIDLAKATKALKLVARNSGVQQVKQASPWLPEESRQDVVDFIAETDRPHLDIVDRRIKDHMDAVSDAGADVAEVRIAKGVRQALATGTAKSIKELLAARAKAGKPLSGAELAPVLDQLQSLAARLDVDADRKKLERLRAAASGAIDHLLASPEPDLALQGRAQVLYDRLTAQREAQLAVRPQVDLSGAQLGRELGRGGLGTIHQLDNVGGVPLVGKVLDQGGDEEDFERELQAFERLEQVGLADHPAFVKCFGETGIDGQRVLVLESVPGGDVAQAWGRLQGMRDTGALSDEQYWGTVQHVIKGMLQGLEALHRAGFAHMDVKPGNVMLTETGEVKLIDFGSMLDADEKYAVGMTSAYTAPGVESDRQSLGTDVFAVGASLFERLTGDAFDERYYKRPGEKAHLYWHQRGEDPIMAGDGVVEIASSDPDNPRYKQVGGYVPQAGRSLAFVELVNGLMNPDPAQRISLEAALAHPFITDPTLSPEQARAVLAKRPDTDLDRIRGLVDEGAGVLDRASSLLDELGDDGAWLEEFEERDLQAARLRAAEEQLAELLASCRQARTDLVIASTTQRNKHELPKRGGGELPDGLEFRHYFPEKAAARDKVVQYEALIDALDPLIEGLATRLPPVRDLLLELPAPDLPDLMDKPGLASAMEQARTPPGGDGLAALAAFEQLYAECRGWVESAEDLADRVLGTTPKLSAAFHTCKRALDRKKKPTKQDLGRFAKHWKRFQEARQRLAEAREVLAAAAGSWNPGLVTEETRAANAGRVEEALADYRALLDADSTSRAATMGTNDLRDQASRLARLLGLPT